MTFVTDILLGLWAFYFSLALFKRGFREKQSSIQFWAATLGMLALTSWAGGAYHGFQGTMGETASRALWQATLYLSGTLSLFMLLSLGFSGFQGSWRKGLIFIATVKWLTFSGWVTSHDDFRYVVYDYGSTMVFLLAVHSVSLYRFKGKASHWMVPGILVSFLAAAIQQGGWDPAPNFNHNDLYHVIQMAAVYLLYKGGTYLKDLAGGSTKMDR